MTTYDYGMGGVLRIVYAHSAAEIKRKFPALTEVYDYTHLPDWATQEYLAELESKGIYDIDQEPTGYFKSLLEGQNQKSQK